MARRRHGETSTSRCVDKRRATNRRRSVLLGHAAVTLTLDVSVNYRVPAPPPPRYSRARAARHVAIRRTVLTSALIASAYSSARLKMHMQQLRLEATKATAESGLYY